MQLETTLRLLLCGEKKPEGGDPLFLRVLSAPCIHPSVEYLLRARHWGLTLSNDLFVRESWIAGRGGAK